MTSLLPCAITQKAGLDTPCTGSVGEDERLRCSPSSGSTVPSSRMARAIRSTSSSRLACTLFASRSDCGWFIKSIAASSLVLASSLSIFCRIVQTFSTIIITPCPPRFVQWALDRGSSPDLYKQVVLLFEEESHDASNCHVRCRGRPYRGRTRRPPDRANRRACRRQPRRHLRQRSVAVQDNGTQRDRPPHGARGHRRRRGRRCLRPHHESRRCRRRAVRVL